jgi:O-acetyl-ADP-ribose deacetylase (regulator of RNase III)
MQDRIEILKGDITKLKIDAIVNAANSSLLGGGGVDGAIHREAGPKLLEECKTLNGCKTGDAKITNGYNLPAKYVIHTVGPVWNGGDHDEDKLLSSCYSTSLKLAVKNKIKTIAFPAISTGVYGFPLERAARIAVRTVLDFLNSDKSTKKVIFVCFDHKTYQIYEHTLGLIQ